MLFITVLFSHQVTLRDLRSFKMEHEFDAFSGSLSDFDVHGNLLAACGFSSRGLNGLACDRFLMVYDLRMMRAVTPLQVHVDPLFLRFIPTYTSRLAIISQTGINWGRVGSYQVLLLMRWKSASVGALGENVIHALYYYIQMSFLASDLHIQVTDTCSASSFRSVPVLWAHWSG